MKQFYEKYKICHYLKLNKLFRLFQWHYTSNWVKNNVPTVIVTFLSILIVAFNSQLCIDRNKIQHDLLQNLWFLTLGQDLQKEKRTVSIRQNLRSYKIMSTKDFQAELSQQKGYFYFLGVSGLKFEKQCYSLM